MSGSPVEALEKSESLGSVQLSTLRRAAEALDCTPVHALMPNSSLDEVVNERARRIAQREFARVAHTMKLEAQEAGDAGREERARVRKERWSREATRPAREPGATPATPKLASNDSFY